MKRNLLSIIILALLVVNIVLSAIMMVSVSSASKKTSALVSAIATILDLEINGVPRSDSVMNSVSMADTAVHNIADEMTIPLKKDEDGKEHFAVGKASLSMNTKHEDYSTYSATMTDMEGIIKDIIYSVMGQYTVDEARSNSGQIKEEVINKIQERFDSDFIYDVSFNFLYS